MPLPGTASVTAGDQRMVATTVDIASDGLSLSGPLNLAKGEEVSVEFALPGCEGLFVSPAVVVRVTRKTTGFLLGLRFLKPEGWVIRHVEEYVREQLLQRVHARNAKSSASPDPSPNRSQGAPNRVARAVTIDLDQGDKAREASRLFKEAAKDIKRK